MAVFALVPAAGQSRRMGTPKLSLPLGDKVVLQHVLSALVKGGSEEILVVVGPSAANLATYVAPPAKILVLPHDTADMRTTIEGGLHFLTEQYSPTSNDAFLLALADQPTIHPDTVAALLRAHLAQPGAIRVPIHAGKRGHPVLFPWDLAKTLFTLPPDQGLNQLLRQFPQRVVEMPVPHAEILDDLDDPSDYERHRQRAWGTDSKR